MAPYSKLLLLPIFKISYGYIGDPPVVLGLNASATTLLHHCLCAARKSFPDAMYLLAVILMIDDAGHLSLHEENCSD